MMRYWLATLLLLFTLPAHAAPDYAAINKAAVEKHILPRLDALQQATQAFAANAAKGCDDLDTLRQGWRQANLAWQNLQHIRFGPVLLFNRLQRFAYWPDPRNSVARQMAELFAAGKLPDFGIGSIAVQGLTALERELFDAAEVTKLRAEPFRCQWVQAAASNLATMASDVRADWGAGRGYAEQFIAAKGNLVVYAGPDEATQDLFKSLHTAIELVADHKLARPLGKTPREQKPMAAEYWRSGQSGAAIAINLAAARDLFAQAIAPNLADKAQAAELSRRFEDLAQRTHGLDFESALANPAQRAMLDKLRADAGALKNLLAEKLAPALDIQVGFNALDGD
ncbi:imelysin family protein [Ferrovibrio sp. MS7]|uniref:imelysin family protein n=1 Tax=Ferrovibrio plantarum TaxID=3119164 RepID=UPI003134DC75